MPHRSATRAARAAAIAAVLLALAAAWPAFARAAAEGDAEDPSLRTGEDTGFYVGLGLARSWIDLDFDERALVRDSDITFDAWGTGAELVVGYVVGPRFRTEMSVLGVRHASRPAGSEVLVGMVRLSGIVPLRMRGALRPHLIAGFGVTAVPMESDDFPQRVYLMSHGHVGAGARLKLGRKLFLQGDYLFAIHDVLREYRDEGGGASDFRYVGGTGRSHTFRCCLDYDF